MNKFTKWQRMTYFKQLFDDPSDGAGGTGDGSKDNTSGGTDGGDTGQNGSKGQEDGNSGQGADEKKYTDADLDRKIAQKFAAWQKKQEKAISEARNWHP